MEQGPLTVEQEAELAELQPKMAQWQKQKEGLAERSRARRAAADRVAVLEELVEQGPLTVEQEAELTELQTKVAQQKQKNKEYKARYYRSRKAAAARVAVLEELAEQGPLTVEQEAELAELQTKVAQQKQKRKEREAKYRRAGKTAIARVMELEELAEQGPLTVEQEAELAELRPKAQQKQKQKDYDAERLQEGKAAAARVAELEALKEQGPLTVEQETELAELRPKAQQRQKQKEYNADRYREGKAAAARVEELEELAEQGQLTEEQGVELAELRQKAQQWQKQKERDADRYRARRAAARVVELEALKERGWLTEEQEAELAELRSKVAGRDKEVREVTETGVGGAPVADRGAGRDGVSGWAGADQVDWDGWSADVDLDAWFAQAVAGVDGVQVPQGAADAGVMLAGGADGEFVATESTAFLGPDAGDDAAGAGGAGSVARGNDFAGFLPDYTEGAGSVGLFGGEGADGLFFGEPLAKGTKRTRGEAGQGSREEVGESSGGVKRRKVQEPAVAGAVSGSPGDGGSGVLTPTDQAVQQDPSEERKRKRKEYKAKYRRAAREDAARVVELEAKGLGQLTEEEKKELAELQPRVAQRKQKKKEENAKLPRARKAAAVRVVVLEELKGRGLLTVEQEAELAELRPKAQQWQKQKEGNAKRHQARKAAAVRVVELEALKEQGPLTEEQEAELAELQPKAAQLKQKKGKKGSGTRRERLLSPVLWSWRR